MKKVSVIIPAHNEENDIGKTLEALLVQDYKDIEIIVIDNASTDKTSEVARRYEQCVKVNDKNQTGVRKCRSKTKAIDTMQCSDP
jgi:glycosyltransferase involved in cell wall biosynthesis